MISPAANVIQLAVELVPRGGGDMVVSGGLAGRLMVRFANWQLIGRSGVGVENGRPLGAAVGTGPAGRRSGGIAGVAVRA